MEDGNEVKTEIGDVLGEITMAIDPYLVPYLKAGLSREILDNAQLIFKYQRGLEALKVQIRSPLEKSYRIRLDFGMEWRTFGLVSSSSNFSLDITEQAIVKHQFPEDDNDNAANIETVRTLIQAINDGTAVFGGLVLTPF